MRLAVRRDYVDNFEVPLDFFIRPKAMGDRFIMEGKHLLGPGLFPVLHLIPILHAESTRDC